MGIEGNKATTTTHEHDFLSLYTATAAVKDPALQYSEFPQVSFEDARLPAAVGESVAGATIRRQQHALLPGGIGTFSVGDDVQPGALPPAAAAVVKAEPPPLVLWGQATPAVQPVAARGHHHQWTLPFAGVGQVQQQPREGKRRVGGKFMDSGSRSSGGAGFDDDDDGLAARREVSSSLKELTVRVDGKGGSCSGSGTDQRPNTPRSKHSATEQRRRSKINDRFQILRELLPHSDQKRDKATFLLEVIEYIRFCKRKSRSMMLHSWNGTKKMRRYFHGQIYILDRSGKIHRVKVRSLEMIYLIHCSSSGMGPLLGLISLANLMRTTPCVSYRSAETLTNITNNVASQAQVQAQWASPSGVEHCAMNSEMLNNEQLAIDEGTISLSSQYSQQLLGTLTHALESSGVDLSQANISVQINLGKRAVKRPGTDGSSPSSKELPDPASNNGMCHQLTMLGGCTEDLPHAAKRHKSGDS
ncbi:hypothetical protein GUJ93_ZPchr0009g2046 [Zizania palustris]|uniref:BHLH domain-containing protein n=1 Tax=Zizania palustris TaxID=103762 RepID=A0A8J5VJZ6_ZIZPA|nr:hypothetical protein GUJ93_ZPchr0009g2046 [Zizania palustris]